MKKVFIALLVSSVALTSSSCKKKIYGCTDETAENHSEIATDDDGSCMYEVASVTKSDLTFYTFDFSGSGGYYTAPFTISNIDANDAVFFEWKCGTCGDFEAVPKTWDDFIRVGVLRNGSSFTLENKIYDGSAQTASPYFDLFSGQTLRMYIISNKILQEEGISIEDTEAISNYVHSKREVI